MQVRPADRDRDPTPRSSRVTVVRPGDRSHHGDHARRDDRSDDRGRDRWLRSRDQQPVSVWRSPGSSSFGRSWTRPELRRHASPPAKRDAIEKVHPVSVWKGDDDWKKHGGGKHEDWKHDDWKRGSWKDDHWHHWRDGHHDDHFSFWLGFHSLDWSHHHHHHHLHDWVHHGWSWWDDCHDWRWRHPWHAYSSSWWRYRSAWRPWGSSFRFSLTIGDAWCEPHFPAFSKWHFAPGCDYATVTHVTHYEPIYLDSVSYVEPAPPATPATSITFDACRLTLAEGWALLAADHVETAADAFACIVDLEPDNAEALAGLAIARGLLGWEVEAIDAMRRAARVQPEALEYVPVNEWLRDTVGRLADEYDARARQQYGDVDALFMVAALRLMLSETAAAHYAVEVAVTQGDRDAGTLLLRRLLTERIEESWANPAIPR